MLPNKAIGQMIRIARTKRGLTQEELANELYVTKQAVSDWELGKHRPSPDLWRRLNEFLKIDITDETESHGLKAIPLKQIDGIETLNRLVAEMINCLELDSLFEHSLKKLLKMTLQVVLAYECYCRGIYWRDNPDDELDWALIAWDVGTLLKQDTSDFIPVESKSTYSVQKYPLAEMICYLTQSIEGELFEDFDEDGFRDGYLKKLAHSGVLSGYELLKVLPKGENSLLTSYKLALLELAEAIGKL